MGSLTLRVEPACILGAVFFSLSQCSLTQEREKVHNIPACSRPEASSTQFGSDSLVFPWGSASASPQIALQEEDISTSLMD